MKTMRINLIDADSTLRDICEVYKCTKDNFKETMKKINSDWDICEDDAFDDLCDDLRSCGCVECEDYGGSTWKLEIE